MRSAMKEKSESVLVAWLFVVLIITQIYSGYLTARLTVDRSTKLLSDNHFEKYNDEVRVQRFGRNYNLSSFMNHLEKISRQIRDVIVVDSCPKYDWGYYDRRIMDSVMYNGNKLCFANERDWETPSSLAEKRGIVDVLKTCRRACPKTLQTLISKEGTSLHSSVMGNRRETTIYLLQLDDFIRYLFMFEEKSSFYHKEYFLDSLSPLFLVVSTVMFGSVALAIYLLEQQSLGSSVDKAVVDVFLRLIGDVCSLFDGRKSHGPSRTRISNLALDHTDTDCKMVNGSSEPVKPSSPSTTTANKHKNQGSHCVLLLLAAMISMLTFQAALVFPSDIGKGDPVTIRLFVLFNSSCFVASMSIMIHLLGEFPLKPWPQVSVSTLFGSYMWLMKAISPREALPVFLISIPVILMAATGKLLRFSFV